MTARKGSRENAVAEVRQAKSNPRSLFHAHKAGNCTEPDFPPPCARRSWPQGHESLLSCSPLYPKQLGQCMAHSGYWINMCEGWLPAPSFSSRLGPTPLIGCPWPWHLTISFFLNLHGMAGRCPSSNGSESLGDKQQSRALVPAPQGQRAVCCHPKDNAVPPFSCPFPSLRVSFCPLPGTVCSLWWAGSPFQNQVQACDIFAPIPEACGRCCSSQRVGV